jgi:hypothetical protein
MQALHKIGVTLGMIKWEHSIFALPFALTHLYQAFWIRGEIFRGCSS